MPNDRVLPVLLSELSHVADGQMVLINTLGTHRPHTDAEMVELLGTEILGRYQVIQHNCCADDSIVYLGVTRRSHEV